MRNWTMSVLRTADLSSCLLDFDQKSVVGNLFWCVVIFEVRCYGYEINEYTNTKTVPCLFLCSCLCLYRHVSFQLTYQLFVRRPWGTWQRSTWPGYAIHGAPLFRYIQIEMTRSQRAYIHGFVPVRHSHGKNGTHPTSTRVSGVR